MERDGPFPIPMKNEEEPDDARRSKKNQRSWFCINQTAEKI